MEEAKTGGRQSLLKFFSCFHLHFLLFYQKKAMFETEQRRIFPFFSRELKTLKPVMQPDDLHYMLIIGLMTIICSG